MTAEVLTYVLVTGPMHAWLLLPNLPAYQLIRLGPVRKTIQ